MEIRHFFFLFFNPDQYRASWSDVATKKSCTDSISINLTKISFVDMESVDDFFVAASDLESLYCSGLKNNKKLVNLPLGKVI